LLCFYFKSVFSHKRCFVYIYCCLFHISFFRTINVEYNQLDSLLRSAGYVDGDVNDPDTGYSPFPGNINQLVFALGPYVETLEKTKGLMPEFVNPKYKDETKTEFKSPTRLECMMQDFPIMLEDNYEYMKRVGYTTVAAELCFSPVKNNILDGKKLQDSGIAAATAATGESDQYNAQRIILRNIGVNIEESTIQLYHGIKVIPSPAIVLQSDFVQFPGDYFDKFPFPCNVKISNRSTLIVRGSGVVIESLDLDGTCIIDYPNGEKITIRDKVIRNAGWKRIRCDNNNNDSTNTSTTNEIIRIRGYYIEKIEQEIISKDGSCTVCCIM
jgi:UDP-sugar pyrophosphorylase